jgi:hypothetical protein
MIPQAAGRCNRKTRGTMGKIPEKPVENAGILLCRMIN